ncbi:MAG: hypothetical protein CSA66_06845 [Proteobacteria bacterium]|nr:MAG: hypothetical protein CSA66_06845 [Pseudomonadota bacterium]
MAATGYLGAALVVDDPTARAGLGLALGVGAGLAKEALDATGSGDPCVGDVVWTGLGALLGVALAWALDAEVAPPSRPQPRPQPQPPSPLRGFSAHVDAPPVACATVLDRRCAPTE